MATTSNAGGGSSMGNAGQGTRGMSGSDWTRMQRLRGAKNNYNDTPVVTNGNLLTTAGTNTTAGNGVLAYVGGSNTPTVTSTTYPNTITVDAATGLANGQAIVFTNTFGGLASGSTYYISNLSGSTFSLATSYANAINQTSLVTVYDSVGNGIISFPVTVLYNTATNFYLSSVVGIFAATDSTADKITFATAFNGNSAGTYSIYSVATGSPGYITLATTANQGTPITTWTPSPTSNAATVGVYGISLSGGALTDSIQSTNLSVGQSVIFHSTAGSGGSTITAGNVYFIKTLGTIPTTTITFATTPTGTGFTLNAANTASVFPTAPSSYAFTWAIGNPTRLSNGSVTTSTHSVGQPIVFDTIINGTTPAGTTYWINSVTTGYITVAASLSSIGTTLTLISSANNANGWAAPCNAFNSTGSSATGVLTLTSGGSTLAVNKAVILYGTVPTGLAAGVSYFTIGTVGQTSVPLNNVYGGSTNLSGITTLASQGFAVIAAPVVTGAVYSTNSNQLYVTTPSTSAIGNPIVFNTTFSSLTLGTATKYFINSLSSNTITVSTTTPNSTNATVTAGTSAASVSTPSLTLTGTIILSKTLSSTSTNASLLSTIANATYTPTTTFGGLTSGTSYTISSTTTTTIVLSSQTIVNTVGTGTNQTSGIATSYLLNNSPVNSNALTINAKPQQSLSLFVSFVTNPVQSAIGGNGTYLTLASKVILTFGIKGSAGNRLSSIHIDLQSATSAVYYQINDANPVSGNVTVAAGDVLGFIIVGSTITFYKNNIAFASGTGIPADTYQFVSSLNNLGGLTVSQNFSVSYSQATVNANSIIQTNSDISPQMAAQYPYNPSILIKPVVGTGKIRRPASNWTDYVASQTGDFITVSQNANNGIPTGGIIQNLTKICDSAGTVYSPSKNIIPGVNQFNRLKILS